MIVIKSPANIILTMAKTRHKQRHCRKNHNLFINLGIFLIFSHKNIWRNLKNLYLCIMNNFEYFKFKKYKQLKFYSYDKEIQMPRLRLYS